MRACLGRRQLRYQPTGQENFAITFNRIWRTIGRPALYSAFILLARSTVAMSFLIKCPFLIERNEYVMYSIHKSVFMWRRPACNFCYEVNNQWTKLWIWNARIIHSWRLLDRVQPCTCRHTSPPQTSATTQKSISLTRIAHWRSQINWEKLYAFSKLSSCEPYISSALKSPSEIANNFGSHGRIGLSGWLLVGTIQLVNRFLNMSTRLKQVYVWLQIKISIPYHIKPA